MNMLYEDLFLFVQTDAHSILLMIHIKQERDIKVIRDPQVFCRSDS